MNREQLNYTKKRIESVAISKIRMIDKKSIKGFELSSDERYKLIKNGKAALKDSSEINKYTYLFDAYVFPGEKEYYAKQLAENLKIQKRIDAIIEEKDRLLDKIHLEKDCAEVIRLLEAFINKKF